MSSMSAVLAVLDQSGRREQAMTNALLWLLRGAWGWLSGVPWVRCVKCGGALRYMDARYSTDDWLVITRGGAVQSPAGMRILSYHPECSPKGENKL
jgi:hypothetical protein